MFRLLAWFIGLTLGTVAVAAFLLLTEAGNGLLRPLAEQALQHKLTNARVTLLDIRPDHTHLAIQLSQDTQLTLNAKIDLFAAKATGTWQAVSKDLTQLDPITPIALTGAASSEGNFDVSWTQQAVSGKLLLTLSQLSFQLSHAKDSPINLNAQGKLLLSEIEQLLQQPELATGHLQLVAQLKLDDWRNTHTLNGTIGSNITDGLFKAQTIQEKAAIALPSNTPFVLNTTTDILAGKTLSQALLNSPLLTFGLTNLRYNMGDAGFTSDHQTQISDLNKLSFITETALHGRLQINGNLTYTLPTHHLILDASSQTLGGKITTKLNGDQLNAQLNDLQSTELATMLGMPVVFKSSMKGDFAYDLKRAQGKFDISLYDGQILPNEFSLLLNNAAKFDITREVYQQAHTDGTLNAGIVVANLDLQSHLTHLSAQNAQLNLKQHLVDIALLAQVKGFTIPVQIKGDLSEPKVKSDLGSWLNTAGQDAAKEAVNAEKQHVVDTIKQQLGIPVLGR